MCDGGGVFSRRSSSASSASSSSSLSGIIGRGIRSHRLTRTMPPAFLSHSVFLLFDDTEAAENLFTAEKPRMSLIIVAKLKGGNGEGTIFTGSPAAEYLNASASSDQRDNTPEKHLVPFFRPGHRRCVVPGLFL